MFKKKFIFIIFLLLLVICTFSPASASDSTDKFIIDSNNNLVDSSDYNLDNGFEHVNIEYEKYISNDPSNTLTANNNNNNNISNDPSNTLTANNNNNNNISNDPSNSLESVNEDINKKDISIKSLKGSNKGTFTELQKLINNAKAKSTINLNKDYSFNKDFSSNGLLINKSLTINGNGHTIDGLEESQLILIIHASNIVFKNIVFKNGSGNEMGAINVLYSRNISFNNCSFLNNYADYGTIFSTYNNYSSFNNCHFEDNAADYSGGAIYLAYNNYATFKSCSFNGNSADYAGAIYLAYDNYSSFLSCDFDENSATYYGGSLILEECLNSSFRNCKFYENVVKNYFDDLDDNIDMSDNDPEEDDFENYDNSHLAYLDHIASNDYAGGAIFLENSYDSYFDSCIFNENFVSNGVSGAIYLDNGNAYFNSCRFDENEAEYSGGAISAYYANLILNSCSFDENQAYDGACISIYLSDVYFSNSSFGNSNVEGVGGDILIIQSSLTIDGGDFYKGAISNGGGNIYSEYSMILIENSRFYDSYSSSFGGSLSFNNDYITINNCSFIDCFSEYNGGGAIYCENSILNCSSSQFKNCYSYFGGVICSLNTELYLEKNDFYNNSAEYFGGSIYSIYGSLTLDSSVFSFNYGQYGGSIYIKSPHTIYNITNNQFLYNSAKRGSKIYIEDYYGDIPESGNKFEEVYFALAEFYASLDNIKYDNYSNVLAYVISDSKEFQNNLSFYNQLRDNFILENEIDYSNSSNITNVNIFDEKNPNNSTIFLNINDFSKVSINYDSTQFTREFDSRELYLKIFNLKANVRSYSEVYLFRDKLDKLYGVHLGMNTSYNIAHLSSNNDKFGWESYPILEDNLNINELLDGTNAFSFYSLDADTFPFDRIKGKSCFDFRTVKSYFLKSNISDFESHMSLVPLISSIHNSIEPTMQHNNISYGNNHSVLPSSYDSRDYGYISSVKDQDVGGNCWAFAGIATLEACLKKITGVEYDFSEDNAKNLMSSSSIYGLNLDSNSGGYDTMFMAYLTSWLGPIDEEEDSYNPLSSISQCFRSSFHIQDIYFLDPRQNSSDNAEFKKAIMDYGAVSAIFDWTVKNISSGFHAVSIVGWDDEYNGIDCLGNNAKGAWIFKNSWGKSWGEKGYGYLSYEQKLSEEIVPYMHAYTFAFSENDIAYNDIYQYDFAGLTDYLTTNTSNVYLKNKFTANDNEFLYAFSTYFEKGTYFTYSVTINGKEINDTEDGIHINNSIHYSPSGYHTTPLGYNLTLNKGDEFEIIIKLLNNDGNSLPVCQVDELYKLTYPSNVSFISYDGRNWIDLHDLSFPVNFSYGGIKSNSSQVACIKAFTSCWRINPDSSILNSKYHKVSTEEGVRNKHFEIIELNVGIFDKVIKNENMTIFMYIDDFPYEYDQWENFIEIKINDKLYYAEIINGIAYLDIIFDKEGHYNFTAQVKSNIYSSNVISFDFIVVNSSSTDNTDSLDINNSSTNNPHLNVDKSNVSNFKNLQKIIDEAKEGSMISLEKDYVSDLNNGPLNDYIIINKSITIDGKGHSLNALRKSGILNISANVTLKNINFFNSNKSAIVSNGKLIISNCNFINNFAIKDTSISSNDLIFISNSKFINNSAESGSVLSTNSLCFISNSKFINNSAKYGSLYIADGVTIIKHSIFLDNYGDSFGGAIYCLKGLNISFCNFMNNSARYGGAINLGNYSKIIVDNSNFTNNSAEYGGAIFGENGFSNIRKSVFKGNFAKKNGGAIYLKVNSAAVKNCDFINNSALKNGASIYSIEYLTVGDSYFESKEDVEFIYFNKINESNEKGLDFESNEVLGDAPAIYYVAEIPCDFEWYLSFENFKTHKGSSVEICELTDGYFNKIRLNEIEVKLTNKNNKSDIKKIKVRYDSKSEGYVLNTSSLNYGAYELSGNISKYSSDCSIEAGTLYIMKKTVLKAPNITKAYGTSKKLTITLKDIEGKAIKNVYIKVRINGKTYKVKTNSKGQAKLAIKLSPKTYNAYINFEGHSFYLNSSTKAKVIVKKAKPKIIASKKTFKLKSKIKYYKITLKNNLSKIMKNTKVKITITGKTYTVNTNKKGQATFKLKINKIGNFKAVIRYLGSKNYYAVSKKVTISIKR